MESGQKADLDQKKINKIAGINADMELIARELKEEELIPGAYCQSYEVFKSIYRFVERRMKRSKTKAFIILFTIMDSSDNFPPLDLREDQMAVLGEKIQDNLRLGDLYTQYSSCQYLVMVSDLMEVDVERISKRICNSFLEESNYKGLKEELILHHSYPLKPAGE